VLQRAYDPGARITQDYLEPFYATLSPQERRVFVRRLVTRVHPDKGCGWYRYAGDQKIPEYEPLAEVDRFRVVLQNIVDMMPLYPQLCDQLYVWTQRKLEEQATGG
jgi:hypothetical protein